MQFDQINKALAKQDAAESCALTEGDYQKLWMAQVSDVDKPGVAAAVGGVYADRLAWVFVAGYQVAVRRYFDLDCKGWLAYCASEDRSGQLPGLTATKSGEDWLLNGYKTWVAAVNHVEQLVVSVNDEQPRYFLLDGNAPGVKLTAKPAPSFLSDLSQGMAECTDARVRRELKPATQKPFHLLEALAIYSAFCGFVMASFDDAAAERASSILAEGESLWTGGSTAAGNHQLQEMDRGVQQLLSDVDETAAQLIAGWQTDRKLISMYSRGVQKLGS